MGWHETASPRRDSTINDASDSTLASHPEIRDEQGRFVPGVSGNPGGRPKGVSLAAVLAEHLTPADAKAIIEAAISAAKAGDERYFRALIERTDGKVTDKVEVSGNVTTEVHVDPGTPRKPAVE